MASQDFRFKNQKEEENRSNSLIPLKEKKYKKMKKNNNIKIKIDKNGKTKRARLPFFKKQNWEELNSNQKYLAQLFTTKYENFLLIFLYQKRINEVYQNILLPKAKEIIRNKYPQISESHLRNSYVYDNKSISINLIDKISVLNIIQTQKEYNWMIQEKEVYDLKDAAKKNLKLRLKLHFLRLYRKIIQFKKKEIEETNKTRLFDNCDINIKYNRDIYKDLYEDSYKSVNADWRKLLSKRESKVKLFNSIMAIYQKQNFNLSKYLLKTFSKMGLVICFETLSSKELEAIQKDKNIYFDLQEKKYLF